MRPAVGLLTVLAVSLPAALQPGCAPTVADDPIASTASAVVTVGDAVHVWVTQPSAENALEPGAVLQQQSDLAFQAASQNAAAVIVSDAQQYQQVDGFGVALTDAAARLISNLGAGSTAYRGLMSDLMTTDGNCQGADSGCGIGLSMIRIPIGASDSFANPKHPGSSCSFNPNASHNCAFPDDPYSYADTEGPKGDALKNFGVGHDEAYILPELRDMISTYKAAHGGKVPEFIAAAWSAPPWMKRNGRMEGDTLKPGYEDQYADYLLKFVEAYESRGVPIFAITPSNEPGQSTDYPSMILTEDEEETIVKDLAHYRKIGKLGAKILGYDYNKTCPGGSEDNTIEDAQGNKVCKGKTAPIITTNTPDKTIDGKAGVDPFALLSSVGSDLDGLAFHCYGGSSYYILDQLHRDHPDKEIYGTECDREMFKGKGEAYVTPSQGIQELIQHMRHWSKSYFAWQAALTSYGTPNQGHGCRKTDSKGVTGFCVGSVSIDGGTITRGWDFAYLGHASRFVQKNATRIGSGVKGSDGLASENMGAVDNVAFLNPDGSHVVVAYNSSTAKSGAKFTVNYGGLSFTYVVPPRSAATFVWGGDSTSSGQTGAKNINIGFSFPDMGNPSSFAEQFQLLEEFQQASIVHPGPALCQRYLSWSIAKQAKGEVTDSSSQANFEEWLQEALGNGACKDILITFQGKGVSAGDEPKLNLSKGVDEFKDDFVAFLDQYVKPYQGRGVTFSFNPWNETNNGQGAGNGLGHYLEPETAAHDYLVARKACGSLCKVAAGNLASEGALCMHGTRCLDDFQPNAGSWIERYKDAIDANSEKEGLGGGFRPEIWSYHSWTEINYYVKNHKDGCTDRENCATIAMNEAISGKWAKAALWNTEVGIGQGPDTLPDLTQANGAAYLLNITKRFPRVYRIYYQGIDDGKPWAVLCKESGSDTSYRRKPAFDVFAERETGWTGGWGGAKCGGPVSSSGGSSGGSTMPTGCGWLTPEGSLGISLDNTGEYLISCNGSFTLTMNLNGHVVLTDSNEKTIWSTPNTQAGVLFTMDSNGDLALTDSGGGIVWDSMTSGNPGAALAIQDDGNLALFKEGVGGHTVIWQSDTQ